MPRIHWPDLALPPINLWNAPRQTDLEDPMTHPSTIPMTSLRLAAKTCGDDTHSHIKLTPEQAGAIVEVLDALTAYANEVIDHAFHGADADGAWVQERAAELGLLEVVAYDPALHAIDCEEIAPGDTIYVRKPFLGTVPGDSASQPKEETRDDTAASDQ